MKELITAMLMFFIFSISSGCSKEQKTFTQNNTHQQSQAQQNIADSDVNHDTNQQSSGNKDPEIEKWIFYTNQKIGYQIKYPPNWYFTKNVCCPPSPVHINFNNYSDTRENFLANQLENNIYEVDILCNYKGAFEDIEEVNLQKETDIKKESAKINGFDTIILTKNQTSESSDTQIKNYYIVNGSLGCRVTFNSNCSACPKIAESFKFNE